MSPSHVVLKMEGVRKRFGATQALRNVELEARAGEVLALIGENGAGKSTLMKILSGAHAADSGRMTLAGEPYSPAGAHQARLAGVAMIYQELSLAPDLSVEDNILLGQERSRFGLLDRRAGRRIARHALARLGHEQLDPQTVVGTLSVGMQQVVEIARALASDAKVLIFDEPTSSLGSASFAATAWRSSTSAISWRKFAAFATATQCCATGRPWEMESCTRPRTPKSFQ
jgi:ribose transport system ATP-binding protein